jgi:glycosyltransferase involved in cell wall biosynthesis
MLDLAGESDYSAYYTIFESYLQLAEWKMKILFIEPYDGGSHKAFREAIMARSRHEVMSLTLPARFWKWRMRSAALWFADRIKAEGLTADLIVCSDYLNVADFRGLLPAPLDRAPVVLYMHENQMTYPLSPEEEFDFHFGFTNILSCLAADRVVFNSNFHREIFLESLSKYLGRMPEGVPKDIRPRIETRSCVLPVGLEREPMGAHPGSFPVGQSKGPDGPVLLWNHRWEFDKRPEWLVQALLTLADEGLPFRIHLLGEVRQRKSTFASLQERLGSRVLEFGHLPNRSDYDQILESSDVVISCAAQEYFGISVAEAIHAGCYAVLPRDQVYPSLYGEQCAGHHLYDGPDGLTSLLRDLIKGDLVHDCDLPASCNDYCWSLLIDRYDELFEDVESRR